MFDIADFIEDPADLISREVIWDFIIRLKKREFEIYAQHPMKLPNGKAVVVY
jgi:hypothetical protein